MTDHDPDAPPGGPTRIPGEFAWEREARVPMVDPIFPEDPELAPPGDRANAAALRELLEVCIAPDPHPRSVGTRLLLLAYLSGFAISKVETHHQLGLLLGVSRSRVTQLLTSLRAELLAKQGKSE